MGNHVKHQNKKVQFSTVKLKPTRTAQFENTIGKHRTAEFI